MHGPQRNSKFKQGYIDVSQSKKYRGPELRVCYRSSYEYRFIVNYCERNPNVIEWSYETLTIPYVGPTGKPHKYYIDFIVKYASGETYLIEVKPYSQTIPQNNATYRQNSLKWSAARAYCAERKLKFCIVTEKTLDKMSI